MTCIHGNSINHECAECARAEYEAWRAEARAIALWERIAFAAPILLVLVMLAFAAKSMGWW